VEQELATLPAYLSSPQVFSGVHVTRPFCRTWVHPPVFSWVHVTRSLVLYVCFVDRFLYFFFWPLCFLSFFDLRLLITPLVSSNSSYPSRASELNHGFCEVDGAWVLVFCVMFCRSLFFFCFFWPLCCLFFFDIQILITPLVSSNSSYDTIRQKIFYLLSNIVLSDM
jgi:hypothetical protein